MRGRKLRGRKFWGALTVASVLAAAGCGGSAESPGPSSGATASESSAVRQTTVGRPVTGRGGAGGGTGGGAGPPLAGQYEPEETVSERCLQEARRLGEAGVSVQRPPEVPAYEVTGASGTGDELRLRIETPTTSRAGFRLIAEELRARNQDHDALSVSFHSAVGEHRSTGMAYVFDTREAACRVFGYSAEQQENIIREGNGIVVTSVAEGV